MRAAPTSDNPPQRRNDPKNLFKFEALANSHWKIHLGVTSFDSRVSPASSEAVHSTEAAPELSSATSAAFVSWPRAQGARVCFGNLGDCALSELHFY